MYNILHPTNYDKELYTWQSIYFNILTLKDLLPWPVKIIYKISYHTQFY